MTDIKITVQDQVLTANPDKLLVSRSVGEAICTMTLDDSWAGYTVTLVFAAAKVQKSALVPNSGVLTIPWEVLEYPGYLWISAVGRAPGKCRPTAIMRQPLTITTNGRIEGGPPAEYSPALWEQVLTRLEGGTGGGDGSSAGALAAQKAAEEAQRKAEEARDAAEEAAESAARGKTAAESAKVKAEEAKQEAEAARDAAQEAENEANAASAAAKEFQLAAAEEARKAVEEASAAAASRQEATQKAGEAAQSATAAQNAQADAEAAKGAAEAARAAIPVPVPGSEDDGKIPVARGGAYQLETISVGTAGGGVKVLADDTLQEAAAYTFQGTGAADVYRQLVIEIACLAQSSEVKIGNSTILGTSIATYFVSVGNTDNVKTTIDLDIINNETAVFRRSCIKTANADPMNPNTLKSIYNQMVISTSINAESPLLKIPVELPAGTRIRITGVKR